MRLLDLFCGMGGWSIGFHRQGIHCTGLDIQDVGYPYILTLQDIRDYHCEKGLYDIVVASPPCGDFSYGRHIQGLKPNPSKGMELVREAKRVIDEIQPRYWALENVRGAVPYISELLGKPNFARSPQYVWGNLPLGLLADQYFEKYTWNNGTNYLKLKSLIRGVIPLPLSIAAAESVKKIIT